MTSRFREEVNAAVPTTRRSGASGSIVNQFMKQFPGTVSVRTVTHIGKDRNGNPMYRISFLSKNRSSVDVAVFAMRGNFASQTAELYQPNLSPHQNVDPQDAVNREAADLQKAKSRWLNWIVGLHPSQISDNERERFTNQINAWSGSAQSLQDSMQIASQNLPFGVTVDQQGGDAGLTLGIGGLGGFGGGGGGGSFGPEYVSPDKRVIEDFVTGTMVALAGTILDDEFDRIVGIYMTDHRRNFDSPNETIDPSQSVVEAVRNTKEYGKIHALRPDSADERTWISDRRKAAAQGGLTESKQEDFAILQATVGGDLPDVEVAGSVAQLQESGRAEGVIERRIRNTAMGLFGAVRR